MPESYVPVNMWSPAFELVRNLSLQQLHHMHVAAPAWQAECCAKSWLSPIKATANAATDKEMHVIGLYSAEYDRLAQIMPTGCQGAMLWVALAGYALANERIQTDPGVQVKVNCAPSMQCWIRRDPASPSGASEWLRARMPLKASCPAF
jgi:hypothetical protein